MIVIRRSDQKLAFLAIFTKPNHAKPHQTYPNLLVRSFWWQLALGDRFWFILILIHSFLILYNAVEICMAIYNPDSFFHSPKLYESGLDCFGDFIPIGQTADAVIPLSKYWMNRFFVSSETLPNLLYSCLFIWWLWMKFKWKNSYFGAILQGMMPKERISLYATLQRWQFSKHCDTFFSIPVFSKPLPRGNTSSSIFFGFFTPEFIQNQQI